MVRLWPSKPITWPKSNTQEYKRTPCSSRANAFVHWCNQDNQTPIITIVIYFDRERRWNYDHRTRINPSKSSTQEYKRTSCSSRANEIVSSDKRRPIITIVIYVDGERRWNYGRRTPITRPKPSTQEYKRTLCSSRANEIVHRCNKDKRTPSITIVIYVDMETRWNYGCRTPITRPKPSTQEYKRTLCSSGTSQIVPSIQAREMHTKHRHRKYRDRAEWCHNDVTLGRVPMTRAKWNTQEYKRTSCSFGANEIVHR